MIVVNKPNNPATFCSLNGESNIDVTLVSSNVTKNIVSWKVVSDYTVSDHNAIFFNIAGETNTHRVVINEEKYYNTKKADWDTFALLLKEHFTPQVKKQLRDEHPDHAVQLLSRKLYLVCNKTIKFKKKMIRSVPWWSRELTELKKNVMKSKRYFQYLRKLNVLNQVELDCAKEKFKKFKNEYVARVRLNKKRSWQDFVKEIGNSDPWGIVYKLTRNRLINNNYFYMIGKGNDSAWSWRDSVLKLMDKIVPTIDKETFSDEDMDVINKVEGYLNFNVEPDITAEEIGQAIKLTKSKKAAGPDNFNPEIIKAVWKFDNEIYLNLLNNCFRNATFPDEWKMAKIKAILKNEQKDPSDVGSYRPIALLSVLGKVYERIIALRIQCTYMDRQLVSRLQYGFKKNSSTEDALYHAMQIIKCSDSKYVVAIFIDIAGAFDNLWWPAILLRLIEADCSNNLFCIIKHYFKNRIMSMASRYDKIEKAMEKGCPQGSILGPLAWNWCMAVLLNEMEKLERNNIYTIAYADDLMVIINGQSRKDIETKSYAAIELILTWCRNHKLKIAVDKTKAMLAKGSMSKGRYPIVKIDSRNIQFVESYKYLGVTLDTRLNFVPHMKATREKVIKLAGMIRRIVKED